MARLIHVATVLSLATAGVASIGTMPARADANAAVCAQTFGKSDGISCDYKTFEQCRAFISGISGTCLTNPYPDNSQRPALRGRARR